VQGTRETELWGVLARGEKQVAKERLKSHGAMRLPGGDET
jgi:hypothetical protein